MKNDIFDMIIYNCSDCGLPAKFGDTCEAARLFPNPVCQKCMIDLYNHIHILEAENPEEVIAEIESYEQSRNRMDDLLGVKEEETRCPERNFSQKNMTHIKAKREQRDSEKQIVKVINVGKDFSITPGGRLATDGPFSGQWFREYFSLDSSLYREEKIRIEFDDGVYGYPIAFLDEIFSCLGKKFGPQKVWDSLVLVSEDESVLNDIHDCIFDV